MGRKVSKPGSELEAGVVERRGLERVGFARAAVIAGLLIVSLEVLVTATFPQGPTYLRLYLLTSHPRLHLAMAAFWLPAVAVLLAVCAAYAFGPVAPARGARWVFAAAAACLVAGGVYALRILHYADAWLWRMEVPGVGQRFGRILADAPPWIAWTAVLVAGCLVVAALLVVAAARVRPGPDRIVPAKVDGSSRRCVVVAGLVAAVTVALLFVQVQPWHSVAARFSADAALGGRAWLAAALFALGQFGWVAVALVAAAWPRRPEHAWVAYTAAGAWGVLIAAKGLVHMLVMWQRVGWPSVALESWPGSPVLDVFETFRQDILTTGILQGVLLACAAGLVLAGLRQLRLCSREVREGRALPARSPVRGLLVAVAAVALVLAAAAPLVARGLVWDGGSLVGFASVVRPLAGEQKAPEATTPTPLDSPSSSAPVEGPVVTGVIPGPDMASAGAAGSWSGGFVQVNYTPNGTEVVPSRCALLINGSPVTVPARPVALSRSTETLVWTLKRPLGRGDLEFTVVLATAPGAEYRWAWTYSF